jgi:hypothetical protein
MDVMKCRRMLGAAHVFDPLAMVRPRPQPPRRPAISGLCSKLRKTIDCASGAIPMPVSATSKKRLMLFPSMVRASTPIEMKPESVNLMAFSQRFCRICRRPVWSPSSHSDTLDAIN